MATTTYFITGASRGLGLEFARQLLAGDKGARVIAAVRNPATANELQKLIKSEEGRIVAVKLDVSDRKSVAVAVAETTQLAFAKDGIDVLINNAGILTAGNKPPTTSTFEELETDLRTNLFGVIDTTQALLPLLRAGHGKKVWTVSSILGSVGGPLSDTTAAATYSISKAALNMYIRKIGAELAGEQFTVLAFHPGYVKTDMNDGLGNIFKEESVEKSLKTLQSKTSADAGTLWNYSGEPILW